MNTKLLQYEMQRAIELLDEIETINSEHTWSGFIGYGVNMEVAKIRSEFCRRMLDIRKESIAIEKEIYPETYKSRHK